MNFNLQKHYCSSLPFEEVVERLNSITEKYQTNTSNRFKFEGKITSSSFELKPTFDFSPNYQLRPEILGELIPIEMYTAVILNFRLPQIFKRLMILGFLIHLAGVAMMICFPRLIDFPLWGHWWILMVFLLLSYFSLSFFYHFKVNKSEEILKRLLVMHEIT